MVFFRKAVTAVLPPLKAMEENTGDGRLNNFIEMFNVSLFVTCMYLNQYWFYSLGQNCLDEIENLISAKKALPSPQKKFLARFIIYIGGGLRGRIWNLKNDHFVKLLDFKLLS